jgi:hypothetical protein
MFILILAKYGPKDQFFPKITEEAKKLISTHAYLQIGQDILVS